MLTDLLSVKTLIIISSIVFQVALLSFNTSTFNAYAQQGGAATSGPATGGSATAGGIGTCNQCTVTNAPQATGGAAASGAATSGNIIGQSVTNVSTFVDKGNVLYNLSMYTQAIHYYYKALDIDPSDKDALYGKQTALSHTTNVYGGSGAGGAVAGGGTAGR